MFATLHWPKRFRNVLSQSGSFWWPNIGELKPADRHLFSHKKSMNGWLTSELSNGNLSVEQPLNIFLEVGLYEQDMVGFNKAKRDTLVDNGHLVSFCLFHGGHDWLCWREGLIDGLNYLFKTTAY